MKFLIVFIILISLLSSSTIAFEAFSADGSVDSVLITDGGNFQFSTNTFSMSGSSLGLVIAYAKNNYFAKGTSFELPFKLYTQNGTAIAPVDVTACNFVLYDANNTKIVDYALPDDGTTFYASLNGSVLTELGTYPYILDCSTTGGSGGYLSAFVKINADGKNHSNENPVVLALIAILPMILGIILIIVAATMSEDHSVLKIFFFLLALFMFEISLWIGTVAITYFYVFPAMGEILANITFWYGLVFGVVVMYFLIYALYKMVETARKAKQERMNY